MAACVLGYVNHRLAELHPSKNGRLSARAPSTSVELSSHDLGERSEPEKLI